MVEPIGLMDLIGKFAENYYSYSSILICELRKSTNLTLLPIFHRALDRSYYEPVFLNHADGGTDRCNVIRILEKDRMAFFACRDVIEGEELAFDYGEEFWKGREDMKF